MDSSIFKAYDIRGIYPDELGEEDVYKITQAFFTFVVEKLKIKTRPKIVLSFDGRESSPSLSNQAKEALLDSGAEVVDIGLASTPTFYFAVYHYGYDAGLQISASHLSKEYSGLKPVIADGQLVTKIIEGMGMERIKEILTKEEFVKLEKRGQVVEKTDVLDQHIKNSFKVAEATQIKDLKVAADAANATGALYLAALFKKLPCKLVKMNFEIDGSFPAHQPDPSQFETLKQLQEMVVKEKADLGIAPDGDSDRVFFVDDKGKVVTAPLTTSLIAKEILKKYPGGKIGFDVRSTLNITKIVEDNGGRPLINRIGNPFATEVMKKEDCLFFGENSGHYFFRETRYMDDPIPVILTVLSVISREEKKLSDILKEVTVSYQAEQINLKTNNSENLVKSLKEKYKEGKSNFIDGLSVDFPDWRFNIRSSNTEPVVRLNIEAYEKPVLEKKKSEILDLIKPLVQ